MIKLNFSLFPLLLLYFQFGFTNLTAQIKNATNPIIFADVPDMSIIRVSDIYYMSSTTMHMVPGVPIMKSTDLVNWEIVNYASANLGDVDAMTLNGADSFVSRLSCIIQGSTDTTFYILAVYFGSVGIKNTRYALACGLFADFVGIVSAILLGYLFFH